jgi:hypothetical protein
MLLPAVASAQGETTRIEIARGKHPVLTLGEPDGARQFNIWTGPGTGLTQSAVLSVSADASADIADWQEGPVEPPTELQLFRVRFYCAADAPTPREAATSHQCYGVYYGIDPETRLAYVRIPPAHDQAFPDNTRTIYRGIEGNWYRATAHWETVVRPQLEAALASNGPENYWYQQQPVYTTPSSSRTAVGARPTVTPKK